MAIHQDNINGQTFYSNKIYVWKWDRLAGRVYVYYNAEPLFNFMYEQQFRDNDMLRKNVAAEIRRYVDHGPKGNIIVYDE